MIKNNSQNNSQNKSNSLFHQFFNDTLFIENHLEISCFTNQIFTGYDFCGNELDACALHYEIQDLYSAICSIEEVKQKANYYFIKHVSIAKKIFGHNFRICKVLGLLNNLNRDLSSWIDHAKLFYITVLGNEEIFTKFKEFGFTLFDLEKATEYIIQLEEMLEMTRLTDENVI